MKSIALALALISQPVPFVYTATVTRDDGSPDRVVCTLESQLFASYDRLITVAEVCQAKNRSLTMQLANAETQRPVVVQTGASFGEVLTWLLVGASVVGAAWAAVEVTR